MINALYDQRYIMENGIKITADREALENTPVEEEHAEEVTESVENTEEEIDYAAKYEEEKKKSEMYKEQADKWKMRTKKWKYKSKEIIDENDTLRNEFEQYKYEQEFLRKNPWVEDEFDQVKNLANDKWLDIADAYKLYMFDKMQDPTYWAKSKTWSISIHNKVKGNVPKETSPHWESLTQRLAEQNIHVKRSLKK